MPRKLTVSSTQNVREGGRAEWEAVRQIATKPKNPTQGISALRGLAQVKDPELARATWKYMMEEVRVQNLFNIIALMGINPHARRFLAEQFKKDYALVSKKYEGNYSFQDVVAVRVMRSRMQSRVSDGLVYCSSVSVTCRRTKTTRMLWSSSRYAPCIVDSSSLLTRMYHRTRTPTGSR